jgi:hypothetical protein
MYYLIDDHIADIYFNKNYIAALKEHYKVNLIDLIGLPNVSKQLVVNQLAPKTYDWALPANWVRDVVKVTGEDPGGHFVWGYGNGETVPITREGVIILRIYERLKDGD